MEQFVVMDHRLSMSHFPRIRLTVFLDTFKKNKIKIAKNCAFLTKIDFLITMQNLKKNKTE
jgi:hypothetical protein